MKIGSSLHHAERDRDARILLRAMQEVKLGPT